ncbi:MAG: sigma-70 family RNA polymerase sigma factor [Pirellulales bacterium]|nr:sigma-70 family RNA polymerase sigma factor [Pirellulales bacterium]
MNTASTPIRACGGFESIDEAHLLARLRRGDEAAYEWLVRTFSGRMLAVANRMLRCENDAADAVQEAFISAFKAIDSFEGSARIGTWLQRILINACLMKLRSERSRTACPIEELLPSFDDQGHHVHAVQPWTRCPSEPAQQAELRTQVRRSIDQLPEGYREILLLRDIEELDTDQTAKMLQISPGAVKTRLHRARLALRTLLEPMFVAADRS